MGSKLKILLFETKNNVNSLNVIAGAIKEKFDNDVDIIYCKSFNELIEITNKDETFNLIFLSFTTPGFYEIRDKLVYLLDKNVSKNVSIIAGGAHPTAKPNDVLELGINYVCRGEGEKFICDFIEFLMLGKDDIRKLKGLAFIENNKIRDNGYAEQIDLDDYPPFNIKQNRFNPIEITRGCIYACSFCQTPFMFKAKFRHRSIDNICHYVEILNKHGLRDIRFITPSALSYGSEGKEPNLNKVEELLSRIRKIIGKEGRIFFGTFPSEVRPEHITPSSLKILKQYISNNNFVIGAQSGSDEILKKCHRGHNVETIISAVRYCKEAGFIPNVDFIFGFPDETEEDQEKTIKLIENLVKYGARIHSHYFIPLPGSPWANKKPAEISSKFKSIIEKLTSAGFVYGVWKIQKEIAQQL